MRKSSAILGGIFSLLLLFMTNTPLTARPHDEQRLYLPLLHVSPNLELTPIAYDFQQPVYLTHAYDERLFVVERAGYIQLIKDGQRLPAPFLDLTDRVGWQFSEQGLLSLAFHPQEHHRFFVNYTNLAGSTVISEFHVSPDDADLGDAGSERILLTIPQPYHNHNGGQLQFGPDGYLYIGMGDGGSGGDPLNHGQNIGTLLGALLRLDVNQEQPYAIPPDNPFVDVPGARPEIWAIGLRNPWRFSFDMLTGDLYIADVGQNEWEELNVTIAPDPGGQNYGWRCYEGPVPYNLTGCDPGAVFTPPVASYAHDNGRCSITGGYVYRGSQFPQLDGLYFYADYCSGMLWNGSITPAGIWQAGGSLDTNRPFSSFGQDVAGELYLLDIVGGDVYQLASP